MCVFLFVCVREMVCLCACVEYCKHGVAVCQHRKNETPLWFLCLSALAEGKKSSMGEEHSCSESRRYLRDENGRKALQAGEMCVRAVTGQRRALQHTVALSIYNGAAGCSPIPVHAWPAA